MIVIRNLDYFTRLDNLRLKWQVFENGIAQDGEASRGEIQVAGRVAPQQELRISCPVAWSDDTDHGLDLQLTLYQEEPTLWAPRNFVVNESLMKRQSRRQGPPPGPSPHASSVRGGGWSPVREGGACGCGVLEVNRGSDALAVRGRRRGCARCGRSHSQPLQGLHGQ